MIKVTILGSFNAHKSLENNKSNHSIKNNYTSYWYTFISTRMLPVFLVPGGCLFIPYSPGSNISFSVSIDTLTLSKWKGKMR